MLRVAGMALCSVIGLGMALAFYLLANRAFIVPLMGGNRWVHLSSRVLRVAAVMVYLVLCWRSAMRAEVSSLEGDGCDNVLCIKTIPDYTYVSTSTRHADAHLAGGMADFAVNSAAMLVVGAVPIAGFTQILAIMRPPPPAPPARAAPSPRSPTSGTPSSTRRWGRRST